jgi:hypothetical protein
MNHPVDGYSQLLADLVRRYPDRVHRADVYAAKVKATADAAPDKFANFLRWWDAVPLNPRLRAKHLLSDLELQAQLEDQGRSTNVTRD